MSAHSDDIVISAIAAMCPQFTGKSRSSRTLSADIAIPWFDAESYFGTNGFKYFPESARYLLAAVKLLMEDLALSERDYGDDDIGAVIGTNFGVSRVLEEMDRVLIARGANALRPMHAPNFSVNVPASLVSIKHGFRAFNITLTSAVVCGLEALLTGRHALHGGRARLVIAGATEDVAPLHVTAALGLGMAGGACVLALEKRADADLRGGHAYTKVGGGALRFVAPHMLHQNALSNELDCLIDFELDRILPLHLKDIYCFCVGARDAFLHGVNAAILRVLKRKRIHLSPTDGFIDDATLTSVSPMLIAAQLAIKGEAGLIAACSPQGHIGLLYLAGVSAR